jgi:hypothetical protein
MTSPSHSQSQWNASVSPPSVVPASRLTWTGLILFALGLMVGLSAFPSLRIPFGDLAIHPYLMVLALAAPLLGPTRLHLFPMSIGGPLLMFLAVYVLTILLGGFDVSEAVKITTAVGTVFIVAVFVSSESDYRLAVLGLALAVAFMAARGLSLGMVEEERGLQSLMATGNRNTFSLYALPTILLAGGLAIDRNETKGIRLILGGCALLAAYVLLQSANRSGWLGVGVIALLLLWRAKRPGAAIVVGLAGLVIYYSIAKFGDTTVLASRTAATVEGGTAGDQLRTQILLNAFQIASEHPFWGISPQAVAAELATRMHHVEPTLDAHNVVAYVFAGGGSALLLTFLLVGWAMVRRRPAAATASYDSAGTRRAHQMLRFLVLLFLIRGMFSREVLYNPSYCIGFGLTIGLGAIRGLWSRAGLPRTPPAARRDPVQAWR